MTLLEPWVLRARFAERLSDLYGREVPAYTTLVEVSHAVNADVAAAMGADAERLGSLDRVTAERHGAIRVGTPAELAQVARVFAAMGMHPTGYYDLRDASASSVPVVSTAFRPTDGGELARNPFRVFTSLLATADRRFFSADLAARLSAFLATRELFPPRLLDLADRARADGGLAEADAEEFLGLATASFALSREPIDRAWYTELEAVSAVAADIGGVRSTHINHLTPRVLDIDELYRRMTERGITMIDEIQGPPRWSGPDVLLRQTSFRALAEPRLFREADGSLTEGALRVRFGEVEARGIALTRAGRARYDAATSAGSADAGTWAQHFPDTETALFAQGLGVFTAAAADRRPAETRDRATPPTNLAALLEDGWLTASPVVYEDFLPRSAAGIFQSNLTDAGSKDASLQGAALDADWLEGVLEMPLGDPDDLYAAQRDASLATALRDLGLDPTAVLATVLATVPDLTSTENATPAGSSR